MLERFLGVSGTACGVSLFARINGGFQVGDSFCGVRVSLSFLRGFRVSQGSFGMFHESLGMACFAMGDGGRGMFHGLWKVNRFDCAGLTGQVEMFEGFLGVMSGGHGIASLAYFDG
jgi:hypothetical protein